MKRVHGLVCGGVETFVGCVVFVMERDRTERRLTKVEQKKGRNYSPHSSNCKSFKIFLQFAV